MPVDATTILHIGLLFKYSKSSHNLRDRARISLNTINSFKFAQFINLIEHVPLVKILDEKIPGLVRWL